MKGSDIATYTTRFNDLAVLCPRMVTLESKKVECYIWELSSQIQGNVVSVNPSTFDTAKRLAQTFVDLGVRQAFTTAIPKQAKGGYNKKKFWNKRKGETALELAKKQQLIIVHATTTRAAPTPVRQYPGNLPKCGMCNFHHSSACREMHCNNCNKKGHTTHFIRASSQQIPQATNVGVRQACYGYGETGHFKRECPKVINTNDGGVGRVLSIGHEEAIKDPIMVIGTFLLNNSYGSILFNSAVERSFVIHKFKHMLNQKPQSLHKIFTIEMANGKNKSTKDVNIGCTLTLNNHSFQIDLMHVTIRIFDVIIGMDWLSPHHSDILYYENTI
ncbi:uncharacterized protein LOC111906872 [Lactuca sativa]|uniref:uncharacterized protein LOC111906872 n=1 Tax=Lactuca sativa TaxID=4236 RepID=UPI000CD8FB89|nr:uncharacterized protein LOC111906872 [Lactuca sativa]